MAKKKVVKKSDPWGGAAQGTPGFGVGSASALQTIAGNLNAAQAQATPPDPYAAAKGQFQTLIGDATNSAGTSYKNTLTDSIGNEGAYGLDIGATLGARDPGADPSAVTQGSFDWNSVDATNPFSKAALLVRNYKQEQNRTKNSLAAQGQFGGALQNAQSQDSFGFQQGQDSLQKALSDYLAGQARARRDAAVNRDNTINQAGLTGLGTLLGS